MSRTRLGFWSSLWNKALGWGERTRTSRRSAKRRRLFVEPLEGRQMLANDFGAIGGVVYQDLSDNGLTNDDLRVGSALVQLYRDSGNGTFGNEDTLVSSQNTPASGEYRFNNLRAGTYFVKRNLPSGYIAKPGTDVATIVVSPQAALGQVGQMIDSFDSTTQSVTASSMGQTTDAASMVAPESIGGERDLYANLTSASGAITINANAFNQHLLEFTSTALGRGQRIVTWDGVDGSDALDASGLGNLDLTNAGGNTALRLSIGADLAGGRATFRIYSGAGNASSATVNIPATGGAGTTEVLIPFSNFQVLSGSGANLTSVGAMQLEITSDTAVDGQISAIAAIGPTLLNQDFGIYKPMSLGNRVFNDVNDNGQIDVGENGIDGVTLNLYVDADKSGDLSPGDTPAGNTTTRNGGFYRFDNLLPNCYVVQIPESNFAGVLRNYQSSTGNQPTPGDDNVDHDDNGDPVANAGILAAAVLLTNEQESTTDGDTNPNTNLTVDFGVFIPAIDVELDKSVSLAVANPGDSLTYTVVIHNNGPIAGTSTTVVDTLPAGVTYQSSNTTRGTVQVAGQQLTYNVGNLAVNDTVTITIVARINNNASGTLVNNAVVSVAEREIRLDNNQDDAQTTLNSVIDVAILKTGTPTTVRQNDLENYTLTITNNGPSNATGVTVVDTLPTGLVFSSASTNQGTFNAVGNVVTFTIGNLAAGASTQVFVTALVTANTPQTLTNVAVVSANEIETTYVNNRAEFPITLLPPPVQAPISSVGGFVYVDEDNDGVFDVGPEAPIAGVTITLVGTDSTGAAVNRTTTTAADGSYNFGNLDGGTYIITEVQPTAYTDGLDTLGTAAAGTSIQDDIFRNINLGDGTVAINGVNYNFGERRRRTINKFFFLGSS